MKAASLLLAAVLLAVGPPGLALGEDGLADAVAAEARRCGGHVGVHALHLPSGRSFSLEAGTPFPMASVYKLPIALAVLGAVDAGRLTLDEALPVEEGDFRRGMGVPARERFRAAVPLRVEEALRLMVRESDNTATDLLLRRIGGPAAVQARLGELGLAGVRVDRTEIRMAADGEGVTQLPPGERCTPEEYERRRAAVPEEARRAAARAFLTDPRDTATPAGMTALLARLVAGDLLSGPSTSRLLGWMRDSPTGARRIRAGAPAGSVVQDKTGTHWSGANDVGVVDLPEGAGRLLLAVFVKGSDLPVPEQEDAIAGIARLLAARLSPPRERAAAPASR